MMPKEQQSLADENPDGYYLSGFFIPLGIAFQRPSCYFFCTNITSLLGIHAHQIQRRQPYLLDRPESS